MKTDKLIKTITMPDLDIELYIGNTIVAVYYKVNTIDIYEHTIILVTFDTTYTIDCVHNMSINILK